LAAASVPEKENKVLHISEFHVITSFRTENASSRMDFGFERPGGEIGQGRDCPDPTRGAVREFQSLENEDRPVASAMRRENRSNLQKKTPKALKGKDRRENPRAPWAVFRG
jgi:hypothetical protein